MTTDVNEQNSQAIGFNGLNKKMKLLKQRFEVILLTIDSAK